MDTWYIFLSLLFITSSLEASTCPSSCYCDENEEYTSCVGDGLWELPTDVPNTTVRLELRNYLQNTLTLQEMEELVKLEELKLQQSRIETVENDTFLHNSYIQKLDLSQNLMSSVSRAMFNGLSKLRFLDLSSNLIDDIEEAFVDLVNLEQLNLRDNRIYQLTTHTFVGLQRVQYMNLDANNISFIEVGTFQYLTNLAHLIISNNPLNTLSRLDFFGSRLQFIDISNIGLERIPQSLTKFVRDLRLAKNNLKRISAGDFDSYPYLGLLVLDDNCVSEIENDALGRQEYLMRLWLNGNCLTKVPPNLPPSLLVLYMEENKLTDLASYSFRGLIHLEQLFLQRNNISLLEPCVFCDLASLKSLDLQANLIENLTAGVFANLSQLQTLDLSQNKLKMIDSRCFDGLIRLKTLQLSKVRTFVEVDEALFDPLQNLQNLEVYDSARLVQKIVSSTRMLHGLRKVQELNIMHNRIVRLRSDFPSFMPNLKLIKMSGNLWHCDKGIVWLATWIKQSNVQFYSSYSIRCASPEELQYKPLMMLTDEDFIETTVSTDLHETTIGAANLSRFTESYRTIIDVTSITSLPSQDTIISAENDVKGDKQNFPDGIYTTDSASNSFISTHMRSESSDILSSAIEAHTSPIPTFISADSYRYTIIRESEVTEGLAVVTKQNDYLSSSQYSSSLHSTTDSISQTPTEVFEPSISSSYHETTSDPTSAVFTAAAPETTIDSSTLAPLAPSASLEKLGKKDSSQRTVLSSRLRGGASSENNTTPPHWDDTTTVIVSAIVATGSLLVLVGGLVTLFTLIRCRYRYQPVKHKHVRRSSSISYYPQKDEVSIVTLTEGTVGLRTNSHHGLGNKLYYIMENGSSTSADVSKDALPDPQLQELLPHSAADSPNVY